jgi:hypothetical protein
MNHGELQPNDEKRIHDRSDCKGIIKWSYFNHRTFFGGDLLTSAKKDFILRHLKLSNRGQLFL